MSHLKAKMHQIRFMASVCSSLWPFVSRTESDKEAADNNYCLSGAHLAGQRICSVTSVPPAAASRRQRKTVAELHRTLLM